MSLFHFVLGRRQCLSHLLASEGEMADEDAEVTFVKEMRVHMKPFVGCIFCYSLSRLDDKHLSGTEGRDWKGYNHVCLWLNNTDGCSEWSCSGQTDSDRWSNYGFKNLTAGQQQMCGVFLWATAQSEAPWYLFSALLKRFLNSNFEISLLK